MMDWTTWGLWRRAFIHFLTQPSREAPQRRWSCVLRHGRVGPRQVLQSIPNTPRPGIKHTNAGWSSPVARQAHNLKVIVRWSPEFGQRVKLGLLLKRTDRNDEQTEAVFGGFQGEGCA